MSDDVEQALNQFVRDDLNVIARKLRIPKFRRLSKSGLIERILAEDRTRVRRCIRISWWDRYYGHVFGVVGIIGVLLTAFALVVDLTDRDREKNLELTRAVEELNRRIAGLTSGLVVASE